MDLFCIPIKKDIKIKFADLFHIDQQELRRALTSAKVYSGLTKSA